MDFDFLRYSIVFNKLEDAKNFHKVLTDIVGGCVQLWDHTNTLEFPYSTNFKLLRHTMQNDKSLNPWNLDFFVKYFKLDNNQVKNFETYAFDFYYTIEFHKPHEAFQYYNKITAMGIYPKEPGSSVKLVFSNMNTEILLKQAAKLVKNHVDFSVEPCQFNY